MTTQAGELTSVEKELFKFTLDGNYDEVKRLLTVENVSVNCIDDDGMTPLQHAAYKGDYKLCKLLLDCGADVNLTCHSSKYSALTFAGLSGKIDVVSLLLEHGASTTTVNSINKTAAQMAAFVGNHNVVSTINNFIPIEDIEYFTKPQGLEKEPKLPPALNKPVHRMAIMTNIHPVRLVLYLQSNPCIIENAKKVVRIFNILCEKQLKEESNEMLSLKFHHLSFIITACEKFTKEQKSKISDADSLNVKDSLSILIKHWIKGDKNGFPVVLEKFLRQDVREYPYLECSLFQQLVRTLAPIEIGDEPSAISIINEVGGRQRGMDNHVSCVTCGEPDAEKKCSACKYVQYCDKTCQKLHWFTHKTVCSNLSKLKMQEAEEKAIENQENVADDSKSQKEEVTSTECEASPLGDNR